LPACPDRSAERRRGIEDSYGSLEPGKDADVVVWTGDPLEVTK